MDLHLVDPLLALLCMQQVGGGGSLKRVLLINSYKKNCFLSTHPNEDAASICALHFSQITQMNALSKPCSFYFSQVEFLKNFKNRIKPKISGRDFFPGSAIIF